VGLALLLIFGSFLAPVVYVAGLLGRGRAVDVEIARIKAEGEPVTHTDLDQPVPSAQNAAVLYQKCFDSLPRRSGYRSGRGVLWGFFRPQEDTSDPAYWSQAKAITARYSNVLTMAEKASSLPRCRFPHQPRGYGYMRMSTRVRVLVRLAALQAAIDAREGNSDAAARRVALGFKIADSLREEHNIHGQRERCLCVESATAALARTAATVRLSEKQAREIDAAIRTLDFKNCVRDAMWGERVTGIEMYDSIWRGRQAVEDQGHMGAFKRLGRSVFGRIWLYSDELYYLEQMRRNIDGAYMPYRSFRARHLEKSFRVPKYCLFSALLVQSREEILRLSDGAKVNRDGSRIFLGLLAYRDRFGCYPATLSDLQSKLDWQVPDDAFTGKPFIYRRQGRGFLLYSIGDDLKDTGGAETDRSARGDVVWKLDS